MDFNKTVVVLTERDWANTSFNDIKGMSHKELYPEQYTHSLVGKTVKTKSGETGEVVRVVGSRFGTLAILKGQENFAYDINTVTVIDKPTDKYANVNPDDLNSETKRIRTIASKININLKCDRVYSEKKAGTRRINFFHLDNELEPGDVETLERYLKKYYEGRFKYLKFNKEGSEKRGYGKYRWYSNLVVGLKD